MREQTGEDGILVPDVGISRVREGAKIFRILLVLQKKLHNLGGPLVSRRLKHHDVDEAEDRGVHPDAESEHGNGSDGETWRFPELTESETKIVDHISSGCRAFL